LKTENGLIAMSGCNWLPNQGASTFCPPSPPVLLGQPTEGGKKIDVKQAFLLRGPASMLHRGGKNFIDMVTLRINYRFGWGAAD
jgi:hypothetical protein